MVGRRTLRATRAREERRAKIGNSHLSFSCTRIRRAPYGVPSTPDIAYPKLLRVALALDLKLDFGYMKLPFRGSLLSNWSKLLRWLLSRRNLRVVPQGILF